MTYIYIYRGSAYTLSSILYRAGDKHINKYIAFAQYVDKYVYVQKVILISANFSLGFCCCLFYEIYVKTINIFIADSAC